MSPNHRAEAAAKDAHGAAPRITVFMPTYARFASGMLARAVESLVGQTEQDWELLAVDDGSQDGTREYLADCAKNESRITHIRMERNYGLPAFTLAQAWPRARGRYYAWLFDDCEMAPQHLERLRAALEAHPDAMLAYGKARAKLAAGADFVIGQPPDVEKLLHVHNIMPNICVMLRRKVVETIGWYDPHVLLKRLCDWDLWQRIAVRHEIAFVDEELAIERGTSLPGSIGRSFATDFKLVRRYAATDRNARLHPARIREADCFREDLGIELSETDREALDLMLLEHTLHTVDVDRSRRIARRLAQEGSLLKPWLARFANAHGREAKPGEVESIAVSALMAKRLSDLTASTIDAEAKWQVALSVADARAALLQQGEEQRELLAAAASEARSIGDARQKTIQELNAEREGLSYELAQTRKMAEAQIVELGARIENLQHELTQTRKLAETQLVELAARMENLRRDFAIETEAIHRDGQATLADIAELDTALVDALNALAARDKQASEMEGTLEALVLETQKVRKLANERQEKIARLQWVVREMQTRAREHAEIQSSALGRSAVAWNRWRQRRR